MLLAYSLRADLLEELKSLVADGAPSRDDLLAAIDAIEHQNHHYFADRTHSGMVRMSIG